jgi:chorismate mutase
MVTEHEQLREYRKSIENIDAALVFLLAERFRITEKVGYFKKEHDLPAGDPAREAGQFERLKELSESADFDPEFSRKFLSFITEELIRHHEKIRNGE